MNTQFSSFSFPFFFSPLGIRQQSEPSISPVWEPKYCPEWKGKGSMEALHSQQGVPCHLMGGGEKRFFLSLSSVKVALINLIKTLYL